MTALAAVAVARSQALLGFSTVRRSMALSVLIVFWRFRSATDSALLEAIAARIEGSLFFPAL